MKLSDDEFIESFVTPPVVMIVAGTGPGNTVVTMVTMSLLWKLSRNYEGNS